MNVDSREARLRQPGHRRMPSAEVGYGAWNQDARHFTLLREWINTLRLNLLPSSVLGSMTI